MARETMSRVDGLTKRQLYDRQASSLLLQRSSHMDHWRELDYFVKPRRMRAFVTDKNKGDRRNSHIIDNTAGFALRTLKSGMHAGISSPARPWFNLTTPDPSLAEYPNVKAWLFIVEQRMRAVLAATNVYGAFPTCYGDAGLFGTACMGAFDSRRSLLHFQPYTIGSYALGVGAEGRVDTFVREFSMTVWQLIEEYGLPNGDRNQPIDRSKFSKRVLNLWDNGNDTDTVDVVHIITPNVEANPRKGKAKYLPWASCTFERGADEEGKFLRESGFNEFPILAPRWEVSDDEVYGTSCPGMDALGGVKALQIMQKRKAQAVEKVVNPPLQAPSQLASKRVSVIPGDITYLATQDTQHGVKPIYQINPDVAALVESLQDERGLINTAFHADLFQLLSLDQRGDKTAREVQELHEEKVFILGPMMEQMNGELHRPLIDRTFAVMYRAGMIPQPPEELRGVELKVEFTSVLASALKSVGITMQDRFVQSVILMAEAFPEVRHKVKPFDMVDTYAEMTGVDPRQIRSDEEAQQALDAEQEQLAAQAQAEQLKNLGAAGQSLANAPMSGDTALTRIVNGAQQAVA